MNSDKDTFELNIVGPVSRTQHLSSVHKYVILGSSVARESVSLFPPSQQQPVLVVAVHAKKNENKWATASGV